MEPRDLYVLLLDRDKTTTNALAQLLGDAVDQSQLHRFEKGKTKEPRRTTPKLTARAICPTPNSPHEAGFFTPISPLLTIGS